MGAVSTRYNSIVLVPIALILIVLVFEQSIGWVAPSYICINTVLDGMITNIQCSILHLKIDINRVTPSVVTTILNLKLHEFILTDSLVGLIWENMKVSFTS